MSIDTNYELQWEFVIFKATVITKKWTFTGSSFWRTAKEKAFEKLETVAVWRALAFAWYSCNWGYCLTEEWKSTMRTQRWKPNFEIFLILWNRRWYWTRQDTIWTMTWIVRYWKMKDVLIIAKDKAKKRLESIPNTIKILLTTNYG